MKLDTYHRYATFFDAARALPGRHYIRVSGDEAGEAYRAWAKHHGLEVIETAMVRIADDGRHVNWGTLEVPELNVGVHLDDHACDAPTPAPPLEPLFEPQPIEPEIAF